MRRASTEVHVTGLWRATESGKSIRRALCVLCAVQVERTLAPDEMDLVVISIVPCWSHVSEQLPLPMHCGRLGGDVTATRLR